MQRKFQSFLLMLCTVLLLACSKQNAFEDIEGKPIPLSAYQGKWIIINYWASWCGPCKLEIPELNAFYQAHKDKDAIVLGINYDHLSKDQLIPIMQKFAISYPMLGVDPAEQLGIKAVTVIPATFLISPAGKVSAGLFGPQTRHSLEQAMQQ